MAHVYYAFLVTMIILVMVMCEDNKSSSVPASGGHGAVSPVKAAHKEISKPGVSNLALTLDKYTH